jgi:hypothetical protein
MFHISQFRSSFGLDSPRDSTLATDPRVPPLGGAEFGIGREVAVEVEMEPFVAF